MKILLIEPDTTQIDWFYPELLKIGYRVHLAYDGRVGWQLTTTQVYDLIILTPELAGISGYELVRSLRHQQPKIPILMLGTPGRLDQQSPSLQAGANLFIARPVAVDHLLVGLQNLHQQAQAQPAERLKVADLEVNLTERTVHRDGHTIDLTEREFHLLMALMQAKGRVVSKKTLLKKAWGVTRVYRSNTIEVFINALRKKIDHDFSPKLIQTIVGVGYMLAPLPVEGQSAESSSV